MAGTGRDRHCFINVADFGGPAELGAHLRALDQDDRVHARHLAWKRRGPSPRFRALARGLRRPASCRLCACLRAGRTR